MSASVFVGNIPWRISEQELGDTFANYAQVTSVRIVQDRETGRSKGFGFIGLETDQDVDTVINKLDGYEIMGRQIRVNRANQREERRD